MTKGSCGSCKGSYKKEQEAKCKEIGEPKPSSKCDPFKLSDKGLSKSGAKSDPTCGCGSSSSTFQDKQVGKCEKKEEPPAKKSSCASARQESTKSSSGGKGGAGECVCGPKEGASLKKRDCSGDKSKDKCGPSKKEKPKCSNSQEQFRKQLKEKQKESCEPSDKDKNKCHSSYAEFVKKVSNDSGSSCSGSSKKQYECHESQKSFFTSKGEREMIDEPYELSEKEVSCTSSQELKSIPKPKAQDCSSAYIKLKEGSTCSKITNYCRNLAKEYVKPKSSSKCSTIETKLQKDVGICSKKPDRRPASQPPCKPIAEVGTEPRSKAQCICTSTCPKAPPPNLNDFFPLDARNKKLNECIEKYMKTDPGQIISKCSKFANAPPPSMQATCPSLQRTQQRCSPTVKTPDPHSKMSMLLPIKTRQLMGRWAPSAGFYLATTTILGLYVTEWKTVLRYVPMYSSYVREQELLEKD